MDSANQSTAPVSPTPTKTPPSTPTPVMPESNTIIADKKPSSHIFLILGVILLLFVLIVAIGVIKFQSMLEPKSTSSQSTLTQTTSQSAPLPTTAIVSPTGTNSDTVLNQDSANIDADLNTLNTDVSNVDQGLNDQQTNLQ